MKLKTHPSANEFPMMSPRRYAELLEDIAQHGLRDEITLCDGMILDGRNRYRACVELGIEPRFRSHDGDPWEYVWSLNGCRRDLVDEQRYLIWKLCVEKSEEWQERHKQIAEAANAKRSEKAKAQPRAGGGEFERVVEQSVPLPADRHKGKQAKAAASRTNPGAVWRGDRLAKDRPDLAEQVRQGLLKPAEAHRQAKRDEVSKHIPKMPQGKFRVLYADPPWSYNDKLSGEISSSYGGAEKHYPSMSLQQLCAMPIQDLTQNDAVLFLWATSPLLPDALKVLEAWGFKYKASFIWDKVRHNVGHYNSVRHEFLLVATKGSCTPENVKLFDSVQTIERTKKHSEKPEEFRTIIDTLYPSGNRIELFARKKVKGWEAYGNEA